MKTPPSHRFRSLDSLRGIAALIVVVHHLALVVPEAVQDNSPFISLPLFLSGRFAVMVFFVLSGFVLALPYFDKKNVSYGPYLIRRFCRIYIPFAFAVLISAVLCWLFGGPEMPMFSKWLNEFWSTPVTGQLVARQLMMTGIDGSSSISLDPPIWSLIVEMRMSIIFPLLVRYIRRFGWAGVAAGLFAAFCCGKARFALGEMSPVSPESVAGAVLFTGRFVILFLLGIMLAARLKPIKDLVQSVSVKKHAAVLASMVLVWFALAFTKSAVSHTGSVDVFCGIFAMYLIMLCVAFPKVSLRLSSPPLLWLGDISYSLYLIHMPVMLAVFYVLYRYASVSVMIAIAFPATLLAGHVMHYLIERPSMVFGRKLSTANRLAQVTRASGKHGVTEWPKT